MYGAVEVSEAEAGALRENAVMSGGGVARSNKSIPLWWRGILFALRMSAKVFPASCCNEALASILDRSMTSTSFSEIATSDDCKLDCQLCAGEAEKQLTASTSSVGNPPRKPIEMPSVSIVPALPALLRVRMGMLVLPRSNGRLTQAN
jgi:hypothetical protein